MATSQTFRWICAEISSLVSFFTIVIVKLRKQQDKNTFPPSKFSLREIVIARCFEPFAAGVYVRTFHFIFNDLTQHIVFCFYTLIWYYNNNNNNPSKTILYYFNLYYLVQYIFFLIEYLLHTLKNLKVLY